MAISLSRKALFPIVMVVISIPLVLYSLSRPTYSILWRQELVNGLDNFGTATYKDGVVYAPSKGRDMVYALNASNGQIIWNAIVRQCDASPCIDGDVIYVCECIGPNREPTPSPRAMALNRKTGQSIWTFIEPRDMGWVGSPLVNSEYVYFTTFGAGVYALNKNTGLPIWNRDIGIVVCSVAYHKGVVFVSAFDPPGQYALNATTGEFIWKESYGASWDSSPVLYEGLVIQVARDSVDTYAVYVLNETTGHLVREFKGRGGQSTPLIHNDILFIPSSKCSVWAHDIRTGVEVWHTVELTTGTPALRRPDASYSSPAAAGGVIFYQSLSGTLFIIDETDGRIIWTLTLGGYGFGSPSVGDGMVFITNDSALYAISAPIPDGDWPMFCRNGLHQSALDSVA